MSQVTCFNEMVLNYLVCLLRHLKEIIKIIARTKKFWSVLSRRLIRTGLDLFLRMNSWNFLYKFLIKPNFQLL